MDIKEYAAKYTELKKEIKRNGKAMLAEAFTEFLAEVPLVKEVSWRQYSPHFNDGDPCRFSRHEFVYEFTRDVNVATTYSREDRLTSDLDYMGDPNQYLHPEAQQIATAAEKLIETLQDLDEVFETVFGDGVKVTVNRRGFSVEDYDHD